MLAQRWSRLSSGQKLMALAGGCLAVALVVGGLAFNRPTMRNLASGLAPETAAQIVKKLEDQKVSYELADGGSTIRVDAAQLYRVRLELAGSGLPQKGAAGFELFDRLNLSSSDFAERVNFLRAMQGELAETIKALPGVKAVRVHLNLPKESVFLEQAKAPTASVLLQLEPGVQLSRPQAVGIRNLVASAIEGLLPEAVTVMDAAGTTLYAGTELTGPAGSDEEDRLGRQLQHSAQALLDSVAGPGRAVASVRVELTRDQRETRVETVEPGTEKSRTQTEENYVGTRRPTSAANTTPPVRDTQEKPSYKQTSSKVEYEPSRRTETVQLAPGGIRRLTASVLVDASLKLDREGVRSLQEAVSAALGIDTRRGDVLEVRMVAFNRELAEQEKAALAAETKDVEDHRLLPLYLGAGAFAGVVLLGLGGRLLFRRKPAAPAEVETPPAPGQLALELPAEAPLAALPPGQERSHEELVTEAREAIRTQPEAVARLIQSWLDEDRSKERR